MIALATFDMAGTTIDDGHHVYRVLEAAVNRAGAHPGAADVQQWMGTEKRAAIAGLLAQAGHEADEATVDEAFAWFLDELARTYRDQPPVALPGVEDTLAQLRARGIRVALTTGFSRGITDPILAGLGWTAGLDDPDATIDAVVCADEVPHGRPAPDMIRRAMEIVGVEDPGDVSATGDTIADIEAARAAGVLAVGVLTGKLDRDDFAATDADHVIDGVPGVLDLPEFAGR